MIKSYIQYLFKRQGKYHLHSPFAYDFYTHAIENNVQHAEYAVLKRKSAELFNNKESIETTDFGAGSGQQQQRVYQAKIGKMAKQISHNQRQNELLFRIVKYFNQHSIIELGTAFGLSSAAMALACPQAQITTLEGCTNKAALAVKTFNELNIKNINVITGNFAETLPQVMQKQEHLDLVFLDGNHREEATLNYFQLCLLHCNENSVLIFDDIHWSKGMEKAWESIIARPEVSISMDLYQFGLVFFRKGIEKQDFIFKTKLF